MISGLRRKEDKLPPLVWPPVIGLALNAPVLIRR
ncbi:hypothetical protein FBY03_118101 [Pseudomonas sp. SJZ079]|jgi:hypothetical protein|nr:hypothetical protein FBY03_118101 [Pseudomonas sp. SJZ079]